MAYIGSSPTSGSFTLLDSISTSATASYTMQKNSVNFEPQSANHMIVSLNGTIQAPVSSFTVSGSTLTFASALTSSDVIDFILVLGNVNDVGVASSVVDSAITKNKTDFITDGSSAGVTVKGSGSDSGSIALNCSSNSHAIQLISPDHSAGQSYKLKLPDNNVTADKFIKVKSITGSGATATGQLEFADAGGETNSPYFLARGSGAQTVSNTTDTTIQFNTLVDSMDSASGYNTSTYKYTVQSGGAGLWYLRAGIYFDSASHIGVGEQVQLQLRHNNSSNLNSHLVRDSSSSLTDGWVVVDGLAKLAVGSEIHLVVYQNTGGNITVQANNYRNSTIGGFRVIAI